MWNTTYPELEYNILWDWTRKVTTTSSPLKIDATDCDEGSGDTYFANYFWGFTWQAVMGNGTVLPQNEYPALSTVGTEAWGDS